MTYNLADLFESAVDHVGGRDAVVVADERRTYAELDERANRLAQRWPRAASARAPRRPPTGERDRVPRGDAGRVQAAGGPDQRQLPLRRGRAALPLRRRRPRRADRAPRSSRPRSLRSRRCAVAATAARRRGRQRRRSRCRGAVDYEDALAAAPPPERRTSRTGRPTTSTSSTRAAPRACPRASCGATRTSSSPPWAAATRSSRGNYVTVARRARRSACPRSADASRWPRRRSCTPARTGWPSTSCSPAAHGRDARRAAASTRRRSGELVAARAGQHPRDRRRRDGAAAASTSSRPTRRVRHRRAAGDRLGWRDPLAVDQGRSCSSCCPAG